MANIYEDQIDPPQSRIEERLRRIEKLIEEGGGGGGDAQTATEEDIQDIKDHTWGDDTSNDIGQGGGSDVDDDETATQEDIDSIKNGIWGD